jgi:hypothetical protein
LPSSNNFTHNGGLRWFHGGLEDVIAFNDRCFSDELIEIERTHEPWVRGKVPAERESELRRVHRTGLEPDPKICKIASDLLIRRDGT